MKVSDYDALPLNRNAVGKLSKYSFQMLHLD